MIVKRSLTEYSSLKVRFIYNIFYCDTGWPKKLVSH